MQVLSKAVGGDSVRDSQKAAVFRTVFVNLFCISSAQSLVLGAFHKTGLKNRSQINPIHHSCSKFRGVSLKWGSQIKKPCKIYNILLF